MPVSITAVVFDRLLAFLTPLFQSTRTSQPDLARQAARDSLASYGARTNRELRLAALSIAFSFGALDALSRAANPDLALNQVTRLRGNANALNRAAQQNENRLEKLLKQPQVVIETEEPADTMPASSETGDLLTFAQCKIETVIAEAPKSRQQRRDAERKAEKTRTQLQKEAVRADRAARLGRSAGHHVHA